MPGTYWLELTASGGMRCLQHSLADKSWQWLKFGAYDLAEWTSLHPSVRSGNPALLTALLLRVPLACLGLIICMGFLQKTLGIMRLAVLVVTGYRTTTTVGVFHPIPRRPQLPAAVLS